MVQAAAVVGTHVAGSAPVNAQRTGLTIADLASPYYIGSAATNITGVYVAVNSGPWSVGVVVTSDAATNAAKSLNILPGGTLTSTTGTVTIDSALQNNGTVNNNANVTFNIGDIPFSNNVTFTAATAGPSRIIMPGTSILSELAGAGVTGNSQAAGWVVGRYQKAAAVGGMNHNFPIGDLNYYAPVNVSGTAATAGAIWASTTGTDHPNLGTSTINPLATVNRYYTIDTNSGLTFGTNAMTTTYNWATQDMDANTTPANFVVGKYRAAAWTYPTVNTPAATSIKTTTSTGDVVGQFAIGAPQAIVSPAGAASFCQGTSVKLSAPGSYTLKVSIGAGCSTISTATVVTETPLPVITTTPVGPNTICQGDTLSLLANFTGATLVQPMLLIAPPAPVTIPLW
ncbi:hypothetical protein OSTOST_07703 [Ostertagia ostertagi]